MYRKYFGIHMNIYQQSYIDVANSITRFKNFHSISFSIYSDFGNISQGKTQMIILQRRNLFEIDNNFNIRVLKFKIYNISSVSSLCSLFPRTEFDALGFSFGQSSQFSLYSLSIV